MVGRVPCYAAQWEQPNSGHHCCPNESPQFQPDECCEDFLAPVDQNTSVEPGHQVVAVLEAPKQLACSVGDLESLVEDIRPPPRRAAETSPLASRAPPSFIQ